MGETCNTREILKLSIRSFGPDINRIERSIYVRKVTFVPHFWTPPVIHCIVLTGSRMTN